MDIEIFKQIMLDLLLSDGYPVHVAEMLKREMNAPEMKASLQQFAEESPERAQAWTQQKE